MATSTLKPIPGLSVTANTVTLLYSVPGATVTTVIDLIVMNQDPSTTGTYQIWHLLSGDSAPTVSTDALAAKYILDQPIRAKERHSIDDREVMNTGDKLYILCTTAVTVRGSILEQA